MSKLLHPGCLDESTALELLAGRAEEDFDPHLDVCTRCRCLVAELVRLRPMPQDAAGDHELGDEPGHAIGRFITLERLGRGSMGVVYAAYDPQLDRRVAVKILHPASSVLAASAARAQLVREAQALARIAHPNVVPVFEIGVVGDRVFVAMEHVRGATIREWLSSGERRGWREIRDVVVQLGRGLVAVHEAGLVHRDIKPENALVGVDGRARVTDLGLARALLTASQLGDAMPSHALGSGAPAGTPVYMAPEQLEGAAGDHRSDQFSFCTMLHEALHGVRPFSGESLDELRVAIAAQVLPPPSARVPAWLHRVVVRGLAADPDRRFVDMAALVAALQADPERRRRRRLIAVALSLGVVGGALLLGAGAVTRSAPAVAPTCRGFEDQVAGAWNPERRRALVTAFEASGRPYAATVAAATVADLDRYRDAWVSMRTAACEATRVRGDQSERILELRMRCLDRRYAELDALVDALTTADAAAVDRAAEGADGLSAIAACADLVALDGEPPRSTDPLRLRQAAEVAEGLARATTDLRLGRYRASRDQAISLVAAARAADALALEAEALFVGATATARLGELADADEQFQIAGWAAEAARHDELAARARLARVAAAAGMARTAEAHVLLKAAAAAVRRAGSPIGLREELATQEGRLLAVEGGFEDARARFQTALDLARQAHPDDELSVARAQNNLGNALASLGRYGEAEAEHRQVLATRRRSLGDGHPDVATCRANLGAALAYQGRHADALAEYQAALTSLEATLGADNPRLATVLGSIGLELGAVGRGTDALAAHRRALAVAIAQGTDRPEVALIHNNLGDALDQLGRHGEAQREYQAALALHRAIFGPDHPTVAMSLNNLASSLMATGKHRQAVAALERALAIKTRTLGPDHVRLAPTLIILGEARLGMGEPARAIAPLERGCLLAAAGDPVEQAVGQALLARALWDAARDRGRAVALATVARSTFAGAGAAGRDGLARVDRWLARHQTRARHP